MGTSGKTTDNRRGKVSVAATGTREWAASTLNIVRGCSHNCRYCYANAMATRFGQVTAGQWPTEAVVSDWMDRKVGRHTGRVMFPSTHDITPQHLQESLRFIDKILAAGNTLLIVSKPHKPCIEAICSRFAGGKDRILFRFTIGSADSAVLAFWEPGAPGFEERLECLKHAHGQDFNTSVSCEPMLDQHIDRVIDQVLPYVTDSIWLGRVNRIRSCLVQNGYADSGSQRRAEELQTWQNDDAIRALYERYQGNTKIKWKESIKKVVGIKVATIPGADL
jgi:DNA repair photolyase